MNLLFFNCLKLLSSNLKTTNFFKKLFMNEKTFLVNKTTHVKNAREKYRESVLTAREHKLCCNKK